jgi:hypothetical protein
VVASALTVVGTVVIAILLTAWVGLWVRSIWWEMRTYSAHSRIVRDAPPRPDEERPDQH